MFISVVSLVYSVLLVIRHNGLLHYLPEHTVQTLTQKSLVDIIQEPILDPLKALNIATFFVAELDDAERQRVLGRLPPHTAHILGTKGIINILPAGIQRALLPIEQRANAANALALLTAGASRPPAVRTSQLVQAPVC